MDKQTSRLVEVTFEWRRHDDGCLTLWPNTLVNNFSELRSLHKFHLTTTICAQKWSKSKVKIWVKIWFFDVHRVMKPVVVAKILQDRSASFPTKIPHFWGQLENPLIGICLDNTAAAQRNISGCRYNHELCEMKLTWKTYSAVLFNQLTSLFQYC